MKAVAARQGSHGVAAKWTTRALILSEEVVERLERRAAACGAPREAATLGAVIALLTRYGASDAISLAVHGRGRTEVVSAVLGPDLNADGLLRRVATAMSAASAPAGSLPMHFVPGARAGEVDVVVSSDPFDRTPAADLGIRVDRRSVELHFREERFEDVATARVAEHLRALLSGLAAATGPVSEIPIVSGEERAFILAQSNASQVRLDEDLPNVVALFRDRVLAAPDALAVVDGTRELTYAQLAHAASALTDTLRARGVGPGVCVAVYLERGVDAVVGFLGILGARGTYVPVDTSYPAGRVEAILSCASPALILTRRGLVSSLPPAAAGRASLLLVEELAAGARDRESPEPPVALPDVRPEDPAYAFFTSGSTGQPKGVVVDHRALGNYARAAFDAYGVLAGDRVLQAASLGFDLSLEEMVVTLTAGAALVVRSAAPIETVQAFLDECSERRLTILSITSALWHELTMRLADGSAELPPLLRLVILGADVARPDVLEAWRRASGGQVRLVNTYGLTETTIVATTWEAPSVPLEGSWRALPIGRPLRNVSAYVLDAAGELAPVGVAGEVCVGGLAVACGYLGDEALNAARFFPDRYLPGGRMYRTGDRGILRSSGDLEFLGRADYRIKVGGVRIELGEIEARMREVPGVVEAVVVARTASGGETELEAHAMVSSPEVTPALLRGHLEALLPVSTIPGRMHLVDRFPLTAAGKIDRRALASEVKVTHRPEFVAPASPVETLVAATVAEVLGVERVGMADRFLDMGGFSLAAVRAASLLEHRLGRRVRAHLFLESRTLREVCAALTGVAEVAVDPVTRKVERDAALDPAIAPLGPRRGPSPLARILLTGATGYYGTFVLAELLRSTSAHVVCLVRAKTIELGRARVEGALLRRGCPVGPALLAERVTVVLGDVAQPQLGIASGEYDDLARSVDTVLHAAAQVNMLLPYEALRAQNVSAVEAVLRFATTATDKTVHHVSTVEVLADGTRASAGGLAERFAATSAALLESGYAQSKWAAEKLVEAARARGVRAFIHRPGRLMGDAAAGAFNEDDFLVRLFEVCGAIGAAPVLDVAVDVTPVDYASRALVELARTEPAGGVFHLVAPEAPSWGMIVATIASLGYPLLAVPFEEWQSLLRGGRAVASGADFAALLSNLSQAELEASIHGGHESSRTRAALGRACACPPIDASLFATYLRAFAKEGRFALASREAAR